MSSLDEEYVYWKCPKNLETHKLHVKLLKYDASTKTFSCKLKEFRQITDWIGASWPETVCADSWPETVCIMARTRTVKFKRKKSEDKFLYGSLYTVAYSLNLANDTYYLFVENKV